MDDQFTIYIEKMHKTHDNLMDELATIRAGRANPHVLDRITVDQARQYIAQGHFAPGSMLPKVESCIDFVEATGATALITSLERAHDALQGHTGTLIVKE